MTTSAGSEVDRVRPKVSALREIAYDLQRMNHPLSAEKVRKVADELRVVALAVDRRAGRQA